MYINITDKEAGNNKGSSSELVHYLEKENRLAAQLDPVKAPECWFTNGRLNVEPHEVRQRIDGNVVKLLKTDAKFFLVNISPSRKELDFLQEKYGPERREERLKFYAEKMMDEYARTFKRPGISDSRDLVWFGKLEYYRYYNHKDKEVKEGLKQRGQRKEGDQLHIQVIVSRKDATNKIKLSPLNNSRGKNSAHSQKVGQFDRVAFKAAGELVFDQTFGFDRGLKDTFQYANAQKKGMEIIQPLRPETTLSFHLPGLTLPVERLLDALLMPVREEGAPNLLPRKKRRKKYRDQVEDLSL